MCGIVGYIGQQEAAPILLDGLRRLEYRGYDSAGLAVIGPDDRVEVRRDVGKLKNLERVVLESPVEGRIGIGHTRWATHGKPARYNAHPHVDCSGTLVCIHNGIVENFAPLRHDLAESGHTFASETDTEVIAHLVEQYLQEGLDLTASVRQTLLRLEGAHGIVVLSAREPDKLIAARLGNAGGVVIGLGEGEMTIASDLPAILEHTRQVVFLENREMAVVTAGGATYLSVDDDRVLRKEPVTISWDPVSAAKGEFRHFMQKEIHEQARSLTDTIRGRVDLASGEVFLPELPWSAEEMSRFRRVTTVACGTSAFSALVGKFWLEALAKLPAEVDYGSEFRYRDPLLDAETLVMAITQSGETVDTLAAMEEARSKGAPLLSIVNVIGSQAQRLSDGHILMHTGPEIGVASTKAFTASLVDQYLLALYLAQARQTLAAEEQKRLTQDLARLPDLVGRVLEETDMYETLAETFHHVEHFLYLGRGICYPIALEGALKLKEISYIHAEGYAAGEMKHGPIALIDKNMPVVAICLRDPLYEKMVSQVEQVKARGGTVIALISEGDDEMARKADYVIPVPTTSHWLEPVVAVVPLQLLAYHMAVRRGCDVDQPRNLAKSVTVE